MSRRRTPPVKAEDAEEVEPVLVRATVKLAGINRGQEVYVDPSDPWIADAIRSQHLVLVPVPVPVPGLDPVPA